MYLRIYSIDTGINLLKKEENKFLFYKEEKEYNMITNKELITTFIVYLYNLANLEKEIKTLLELKVKIGNSIIREEIDQDIEYLYKLKNSIKNRTEKIYNEMKKRKIKGKEIEEIEF